MLALKGKEIMTQIMVKRVTDNDRLSPIGGEKLAKKIISEIKKNDDELSLNFIETGSHSSLFFNALYGYLLKNGFNEFHRLNLLNMTKLDVSTNEKCKANSIRQYTDIDYFNSIKELDFED